MLGLATLGAFVVTIPGARAESEAPGSSALLELGGAAEVWVDDVEAPARREGAAPFRASHAIAGDSAVLEWLRAAAKGRFEPKDGTLTIVENRSAKRRMDFVGAHITELKLPALSKRKPGKRPFMVEVKWQPTAVTHGKASGKVVGRQAGTSAWQVSSFRLVGPAALGDAVETIVLPTITTKLVEGTRTAEIGELALVLVGRSEAALAKVVRDAELTDGEVRDLQVEMLDAGTRRAQGAIVLERCKLVDATPAAAAKDGSVALTLTFAVERIDLRLG